MIAILHAQPCMKSLTLGIVNPIMTEERNTSAKTERTVFIRSKITPLKNCCVDFTFSREWRISGYDGYDFSVCGET